MINKINNGKFPKGILKNLSLVICHSFVIWILSFGIFMSGCGFENDVTFARRVMTQMVEGRYSARKDLDWRNLKILLYDVGAEYSKFRSDEARLDYERSFIANFARGFQEKGAKMKTFFNWHQEESKDPKVKIVAVNCPDVNTTFYFMIVRAGAKRKINEIVVLHKVQPGEQGLPAPGTQAQPAVTPQENAGVAGEER